MMEATIAELQQPTLKDLQIAALLDEVHNNLGQGVLFENDSLRADLLCHFAQKNPDKLILPVDFLSEVRFQAAILGAGFQRHDTDWLPPHTRMWDEILENLAVHVVPGITYDMSAQSYALTDEQLVELLRYDYDNLKGLETAGVVMLYGDEERFITVGIEPKRD